MSRKSKKPVRVALCGRRNVGKSTLFNALLGKQRAITDSYAGLTRDVLEAEILRSPYHFLLSDTPGLDIERPDQLESVMLERARRHIDRMDLVLLVLEAPSPESFDYVFIEMLRKSKTPVLYVINKVDGLEQEADALGDFYETGITDPVLVSAKSRRNLNELLKRMAREVPALKSKHLEEALEAEQNPERPSEPEDMSLEMGIGDLESFEKNQDEQKDLSRLDKDAAEEQEARIEKTRRSTTISDTIISDVRIAIVGRPNAGKSSLLNRFVGREVSLVSDVPGTTRDTVDTLYKYKGKILRIIDTAGMRRNSFLRGKNREADFYSHRRAKRAIRDCDVVIHLLDAEVGITEFDKKISASILEYHKPAVLGINKWDAIEGKETHTTREYLDRLHFLFPHGERFPSVFCSALTGRRIFNLLDISMSMMERMRHRLSTGKLNNLVDIWNGKIKSGGSQARIYYVTQASGAPPTFVFFVNKKNEFRGSMLGYFENRLREEYKFEGIPITILLRDKSAKKLRTGNSS